MEKLNIALISGPTLVSCTFQNNVITSKKKTFQIECGYSVEIKRNTERPEFMALFSTLVGDKTIPFQSKVVSKGTFKYEGELPSDQEVICEVVPYLYPFTREVVADLTRKAGLNPFYIPYLDLKADQFTRLPKGEEK